MLLVGGCREDRKWEVGKDISLQRTCHSPEGGLPGEDVSSCAQVCHGLGEAPFAGCLHFPFSFPHSPTAISWDCSPNKVHCATSGENQTKTVYGILF